MKKIYFFAMLIFSVPIFAAEQFPPACQISGIHFGRGAVLLYAQHTAKPRLYAIQNKGTVPVWLSHQKKKPGMSAGWDSQLKPNQWSVILLTERNFDLQCHFQTKAGAVIEIPCIAHLSVCQFNDFTAKRPIDGGYWVTEDAPLADLKSRMDARGFTTS
ncbi:MAG: hypothetical protein NTZ67_02180 [Gammaproteobacteria bacterium]|nr:hypothetical protein [Gammaproteobacteria bacterium]